MTILQKANLKIIKTMNQMWITIQTIVFLYNYKIRSLIRSLRESISRDIIIWLMHNQTNKININLDIMRLMMMNIGKRINIKAINHFRIY